MVAKAGGTKTIRSVRRAFRVLEAMAAQGPMSLNELHRATGLDRATLLRLLRTLAEDGYVLRSLSTGRYEPAARLARFGGSVRAVTRFTQAAGDVLDRLCRDLIWPSDIGIPRDGAIEIVETSRTLSPFILNPRVIGRPISLAYSAMGQAYLAHCDAEARDFAIARAMQRRVEGFGLDRAYFDTVIRQTRARGYGVRAPGYAAFVDSWTDKLRALAVPVLASGQAIAALNLVWIDSFATVEQMAASHLDRLRAAAGELGARLEA